MTLSEIAKLADVPETTARDVINGKAEQNGIDVATQERVIAIVDDYNYSPSATATDSVKSDNEPIRRSFGLIIPDIENSSYARFTKLLEKFARDENYSVLIACSDDDPSTEKTVANALVSRRIDALIVATSLYDGTEFYKNIQDQGTPVIAIDRSLDDEFFSCVISEDFGAAYDLTSSVISPSITSVGLIGALPDLNVSRERQLGFEYAAKKKGIGSVVTYGKSFSREEGHRLLTDWVEQGTVPDSIVCTSYNLIEGVLDVLLEHDELVSMVRLATFGDSRLLDFLPFRINSVPQHHEMLASSALAFALRASDKNFDSDIELIPRLLKVRKN